MTPLKDAHKVTNISEYQDSVREYTHVAVLRLKGPVRYFHHYLVTSVGDSYVEIVQYGPGENGLKALPVHVARVTHQILRFDDTDSDLLDFLSGLYFIKKQNYPETYDEKMLAYHRLKTRLGEAEYSVSSNNCETLVTWILTGVATCEQFDQSSTGKRILIDAIDSGLDHGKKLVHNGTDLHARLYYTWISNSANQMASAGVTTVAKTGAKEIARTAVTRASAVTAGVTTGLTAAVGVPLEALFCGSEIYTLNKQKKKGIISKKTFKRQVATKVTGSASSVTVATGAGFLGAFVGQIICPIPVLGGAIGGAVGGILGSFLGRKSGSVISGKIFDSVTD